MIIFLGISGAGKGTQAQLLADFYHSTPLSTGEVLRRYRNDKVIKGYVDSGKLVPDSVLLPILEKEIIKAGGSHDNVILDGFPRTLSQANWLVANVNSGKFKLSGVVHFVISPSVAKKRLKKRHRHDDTDEVIAQRFAYYKENILPINNYFKGQGLVLHEIDAEQSVKKVSQDVKSVLGV